MAMYDEDLLSAARLLLLRGGKQRGRLPAARIRRSISTIYYALFHFLLEQATSTVVGATSDLRVRRRVLARALTHAGMRKALDKVAGRFANTSVEDFLRLPGGGDAQVAVPIFVSSLALAFSDAQVKRHEADYDLNASLDESVAHILFEKVERAIAAWRGATSPADRDFKGALCTLMLLKGQLRPD